MLGRNQITVSSTQFTGGLCTSDYTGDGGIGTSSTNLSLIATPGVVRAMPDSTPSGTITNALLASCEDPELSTTQYDRILLDSGGIPYTWDSTTLTALSTLNPTTGSGFSTSSTDMAAFRNDGTYGYIYVTSTKDVSRIRIANADGSSSVIGSWWVSTKANPFQLSVSVPHPLLVYEGYLWLADNNLLHQIDGSETVVTSFLTLTTSERITALGIDPQTGLMMIAVSTITTGNNRPAGRNFVYLFNGYSAKPTRKVPVDGYITAFRNVGGTVFCQMDNTVGYWNGNGVTFMRRLYNVSSNSADFGKRKITHFENTLVVVDGPNVLAFGDIGNGKKVWWPLYKNSVDSNDIDFITFAGNDHNANTRPTSPYLLMSEGTNVRKIAPLNTSTAASATFYTNNINFERPVYIRGMRVFTTGITTTAGIGGVSIIDDTNTTRTPTVSTFVVAAANSPKYYHDFLFDFKTQTIQPKITLDTQAFGVIRIVIYYDVAE